MVKACAYCAVVVAKGAFGEFTECCSGLVNTSLSSRTRDFFIIDCLGYSTAFCLVLCIPYHIIYQY